jgi:RNA polymerase sigma-70 factor (ECF subfamily)
VIKFGASFHEALMHEAPMAAPVRPSSVDAPPDPPEEGSLPEGRLRGVVEQHFDFVWRSLRRLGVPSEAVDDAAQEVFWIMARKLDAVASGSERAYLFATALRVSSDIRRRRARQRVVHDSELVEAVADLAADPDALIDQKRARDLLDVVLDKLPLDLRTVLVLTEGEELTMAEIASLLGVPPGTIASRLRRARAMFQERVDALLESGGEREEGT